ncbi:SLC13 family permease [Streptosporangium carneum]|uniref:Arsenic transporter n=1 Tax=Streptosporangium carneum TaxID=47481 RepID=A0A9W6MBN8_9ACTN|nr:SLC13 family permease [Streptosporangium carneum]GLK07990.1 arsenic transporter [Streptosporangium carneum]
MAWWRLSPLDWIRIAVLAAGLLCVATGLLPVADARASMGEIAPLLLFLASVIILAELVKTAAVFDVVATRLAILGRGNYPALFLLCVAFASLTTVFLNLDTTAVLLTPVMLALADRARIAPLPVAVTTVWLANTASLLLPVSNLTNLLAADRIALSPARFATRLLLPQLVAIAMTMVFLWLFYWRRAQRGVDRYVPSEPVAPADPVLFRVAAVACLLFAGLLFTGIPLQVSSLAAMLVVVAAFAVRARDRLTWRLIPWQLLVFVSGLFLVVPTLQRHGLDQVMTHLIGGDGGGDGAYRAAAAGAGLSNLINNLPAYAAGAVAVPEDDHTRLLALLVGVNVGPLVTPWASVATLLWFEWCGRHALRVPLVKFVLTGLALAVTALAATVTALLATG